ncbi:MAG: agmatinase [bacterium]
MQNQSNIIPFAGCFTRHPAQKNKSKLVFVGLPDDSQSSYCHACSRAPEHIRRAYNGHCYNSTTESGIDLSEVVNDLGDVASKNNWKKTAQSYRECAETLFGEGKIPFFAGGDHAVTVPIVEALAVLKRPIHVVQIDAHPDLYPEFEGSRSSHACTAARMLEMEHVHAITQIGIRTMNKAQAKQADIHRNRLTIISAHTFRQETLNSLFISNNTAVYLTLDMDAFDPAFAPGVSHPVPGGLTSRQVLDFVQNLHGNLVGMDVVEVNPELDVNDQTAILAARLLHESMGIVYSQLNGELYEQ